MKSNPKKPSKVRKTIAVHEDDRLSSFPESILCHILSLLPTKCAARTSILSKQWKYLFLDVPKLVFHEEKLSKHGTFIDFVHRRLLLCKTRTSIDEFRLVLPKLPELSVINLWIISLLFHNLKVLEIEESGESDTTATPQCPPSEVFGWETLVVLKLRGHKMVLKYPKSVIFPNLKVLDLNDLEMQSESEYMRFDHEGFPLLEVFRLDGVVFDCRKDNKAFLGLEIFLCALKIFEILVDQSGLAVRIVIDTPRLEKLIYNIWEGDDDDVSPVQLRFCKSEYLISADLYSQFNPSNLHIELCDKINGVKDLSLSQFNAQELTYSLPHFEHLKHLTLIQTPVESMLSILQNAPMLEVLAHEMMAFDDYFVSPTDVPLCLAQTLKQVRIRDFTSHGSDVDMVRYFLQHGAVLERVTLLKSEWRLSTLEKLLKLPRCSPKCEIELQKEDGN